MSDDIDNDIDPRTGRPMPSKAVKGPQLDLLAVSPYVYMPGTRCPVEHRILGATAAIHGADRTTCDVCKLPVGVPCEPAPDCAMTIAVKVEVRAHEIVIEDGPSWNDDEKGGWTLHEIGCQTPAITLTGQAAGWLAREISTHADHDGGS